MKKYINYKMFLTIFIYILFMELIFSFLTYKNITIYIILFSLIYSLLIYFLYNLFNNKKILYFIYTLILILFLNNYIYYINYSMFITFDVFIKSFKVLYFYNNIWSIVYKNIFNIILLFIPFILVIIFTKKFNLKDKKFNYIILFFCIILHIFTLLSFNINNNNIYSYNKLYFDIDFPVKNLNSFGLLTSIRLNIQRTIFNFKEKGINININNDTYSNNKYNVLDIDFKDSDNEEINEINKYIKNSIPTKKNIYTGLLKDKNLIFILAESFNYMAVKKDITPNLYKLFNEGYTFDNFYNPLFPVSTADGQYLTDISLFPSDASHSLVNSNKNYIPYSLAHMFDKDGYKTFSYHNYKYDYYERDKYYPNMGFNIYKGIGNGLNMDDTRSDYDLVKSSIDEYINEDKFFTYYLTISGHAPYNKDNKMSIKNLDRLDKYDYSTNVKYYLSTQIELDNMIGLLFDRLKENNKLDDTVIVLVPDHVPYGLSIDEMNELSNEDRNDEFYKYKSNLVIYNKDINKYKSNDNYCSNIDILPTMLNLYGFDFDSRLFIGRDILSNNDGVVVFGNRNIVTKNYRYSNMKDSIYGDISNKDIDILKNEVYMKYRISRLILENNYYNYLFND